MQLWYRTYFGNFGDALNPWLWSRLLPGRLDQSADTLFLGIGTILDDKVPREPRKIIFGAGAGYNGAPSVDERWEFHCVRGPLTAERLGLPAELAVTDPAALTAKVYTRRRRPSRSIALMPHHESAVQFDWPYLCRQLGLVYLDPCAPVARTLAAIARSRLVIAEAMHCAILADSFRIPWICVSIYPQFNRFKWEDWCASLGLPHRSASARPLVDNSSQRPLRRLQGYVRRVIRTGSPTRHGRRPDIVPSPREHVEQTLEQLSGILAHTEQAQLSSDTKFADRIRQLEDRLDALKRGAAGFTPRTPTRSAAIQ
jgi:succinoglycan biosynthesis protein ExoV